MIEKLIPSHLQDKEVIEQIWEKMNEVIDKMNELELVLGAIGTLVKRDSEIIRNNFKQ